MKSSKLIGSAKELKDLNLNPYGPEVWEDGLRTNGKKGEYEWWYFDSKLNDGSSLVIIFFTGDLTNPKSGFHPRTSLTWTKKDGTKIEDLVSTEDEYKLSQIKCDVKIKKCTFVGDLRDYKIVFQGEKVQAIIHLKGNTPAWRPGAGMIQFGEKDYFAWLPSIPEGTVNGEITTGDITKTITGTGYHDHNWGNKIMTMLMHHWYWGRAKIGDYQAITSYITSHKKYGYTHFPIYMLAKNGELLGDNTSNLVYKQTEKKYDPVTNKHYFEDLEYDYTDGDTRYIITYHANNFLENRRMFDSGFMKVLTSILGLAPAYIRFDGIATIKKFVNSVNVEDVSSPAIWELMYFGKDKDC